MKTRILRAIVCLSTVIILALCLTSCDAFNKLFAGGGIGGGDSTNNGGNGGSDGTHVHEYRTSVVRPTCTEEGYTTHKCACGATRTDSKVNPIGHKYGEFEISVNSTCEEEGSKERKCINCGMVERVSISRLDHEYQKLVQDPTCTEDGYTSYKCIRCDKRWVFVTSKDHEFTSEISIVADSNCTDKGHGRVYCADCDAYIEVDIESKGHDYYLESYREKKYAATLSVSVKCNECDYEYEGVLSSDKFTKTEKAPTCVADGSVTYTITLDGKSVDFVYPVDKLENHVLGGVSMDPLKAYDLATPGIYEFEHFEVSCDAVGEGCYFCDLCGELQITPVFRAHAYDKETVSTTTPADCELDGVLSGYCTECEAYKESVIPAHGHKYQFKVVEDKAEYIVVNVSCTVEGCDIYDDENSENDGYNVNIDDFERTVDNDCDAANPTATYKFMLLGSEQVVVNGIAKRFHTLNGVEIDGNKVYYLIDGMTEFVDNKATCTENGKAYYICDCCDELQLITTKKDHSFTEEDIVNNKALDCTDESKYTAYCDECKNTIKIPVGHKYSVDTETLTEGEDGVTATIICSECEYSETKFFDDYDKEIVKSTCKEEGKIVFSFIYDGTEIVCINTLDKVYHTVDGVQIDPNKAHYVTAGITEFVDYESTCSKEGRGHYICEVCGEMQLVVTKLPHDFNDNPVLDSLKPTCDTDGWETRHCDTCGVDVTYDVVATGHKLKVAVTTPPTKESEGEALISCVDCSDVSVEVDLPALDKKDYKIVEKKPVSCLEDGIVEYTYVVEDYENVEVVITVVNKKIPHTEDEMIDWTVTVGGVTYEYEGYVCAVCGKVVVVSETIVE